jgi:succinate-semialdehyde dehydrogenase/glutarate-semialdehyde dehydrogenase
MTVNSINPVDGSVVATYELMTAEEIDRVCRATAEAQRGWRTTSFAERARAMQKAAGTLRERREELAKMMALEMGKPITAGRAEVEKCAWVCEHYAEHAEAYLADEPVATEATKSYLHCEPLGVVLAVMPWNFPLWQVFRFAAPALMAGNAGVLKHASNVFGSALAIEEVFSEAGFPPDLFRTLRASTEQVPEVIDHPAIRAVTLTGSTPAGRAVAGRAGQALKKTVLELGGSDPYLILDDADVAPAAQICADSRLINSGQSCIAAKRFIVTDRNASAFEDALVEAMAAKTMGNPMDEETDVGPQARVDLRDELHRQVEQTVKAGARLRLGGTVPAGPGAFYPATVLANVPAGSPAHREELFGPVAAVIRAEDEAEAIRIANDSPFGLGAAVFSRDAARAERIAARELEAGCCFVNSLVRSDPRLAFGGIKESGYGRELGGYGIKEFVNLKTVYVA